MKYGVRADNTPIKGAGVNLYPDLEVNKEAYRLLRTATDGDGSFSFTGIREGQYEITIQYEPTILFVVNSDHERLRGKGILVKNGKTTIVNLALDNYPQREWKPIKCEWK
jgi:hypothetical protein